MRLKCLLTVAIPVETILLADFVFEHGQNAVAARLVRACPGGMGNVQVLDIRVKSRRHLGTTSSPNGRIAT